MNSSYPIQYQELFACLNKWFQDPDPIPVRASLAVAAALDLEQPRTWLLIVGPPSSGKTEIHFPLLNAYANTIETSDINVPGLLSMKEDKRGKGLLARLCPKGLWLIKDFGSVLGLREEKRNELLAAMREIYDGEWQRQLGTGREIWSGQVHVVAAATPAVERYHRVNAELGDRFLTIRVVPAKGMDAWEKGSRQGRLRPLMRREMTMAARAVLDGVTAATVAACPREWHQCLWAWAELIAITRTDVQRDPYTQSIVSVGETEGAMRVFQELQAIVIGDASLMRQRAVSAQQLPLISRLALDTIPLNRGRILRAMPLNGEIRRTTLWESSGINWENTFDRTISELQALNVVTRSQVEAQVFYAYPPTVRDILNRANLKVAQALDAPASEAVQ